MDTDVDILRRALKRLPAPEPRPDFVARAFAKATGQTAAPHIKLSQLARRWETWVGAALGAAIATLFTVAILLSHRPAAPPEIKLALNEMRDIDVLIESERTLEDATIRIVASGSVALDGFDSEREIGWTAHLEQGSNMLSLPVVARSTGAGQLVAVIEHGGRTRRVTVNLAVHNGGPSRT